jgi:serine/threonine-protein kinase
MFVYIDTSSAGAWPILWLDRAGGSEPLLASPGPYQAPRFSPDGNRLALSVGLADIQVYDLVRDTMTRLTFTGQGNGFPVWTVDGKHIVFRSVRPGGYSLQWIRSDGGGAPQPFLDVTDDLRPYSFSPDGRRLAFAVVTADGANDLWTLPIDVSDAARPKPGTPTRLLSTPFNELEPAISQDGRWLAYTSDESGRPEVYVRPFGSGGELGSGKWPISAGGRSPIWSRNGRELFYAGLDDRIMTVSYTVDGDAFAADKPTLYSNVQFFSPNASSWSLDLAPDGSRFAILSRPDPGGEQARSVHVNFLMNFFDDVRRRIPADR